MKIIKNNISEIPVVYVCQNCGSEIELYDHEIDTVIFPRLFKLSEQGFNCVCCRKWTVLKKK